MIRIIIADDQPIVRDALKMISSIQPDLTVVGEAADGREAVDLAIRLRPDVAVLDIRMPGLDGIAATRELVRYDTAGPSDAAPVRILILTTFDDDAYVHEALQAGASGFLIKNAPPEDIVSAIRVVATGESLLAPSVTTRLIRRFVDQLATGAATRRTLAHAQLTERESDVLEGMAKGLSNAEIGRDLYISETTVKTHASRVLAKLGVRDRVQAVIFAYEAGLVIPGGG